MTIEPTEFDMIALARRGLHALLDEAVAEVKIARDHELWDRRTGQLTPESEEAKAKAFANWTEAMQRLVRFQALYPERKDHPFDGPTGGRDEKPAAHPFYGPDVQ